MKQYQGQVLPAVILIPGVSGNTGEGVAGVKRSVEQAVGSDILFQQSLRKVGDSSHEQRCY